MILKKGSFSDFAGRTKITGKKIIVYGAGAIGQTVAPYWLSQYDLDGQVLCYVDADPHKQGQYVPLFSQNVPIRSLDALEELSGRYILLITVSAFKAVIQNVERIQGTRDTEAYFLPVMLLDIAHAPKEGGVIKSSETQLIPKRIHYCWFGGNPIPENLQRCVDSWKKFCPDYEIIRWDESNYDVAKSEYTKQAYANGKWGWVADCARLEILYQYGGIYFDTDVELVRNLDEMLYQPAFCAAESWGCVNFGGGSGAQAGNPAIKAMLDYRVDVSFLYADGTLNLTPSGLYETPPLIKLGLQTNGQTQSIANGMMNVYAADFFHPMDYTSGTLNKTENTFSIHHYSATWIGEDAIKERADFRQRYLEFLENLEA